MTKTLNLEQHEIKLLQDALTCAMSSIITKRNELQDMGLYDTAKTLTHKHGDFNDLLYRINTLYEKI